MVRFAHDLFYFADLQAAVSCKVFLEQDECVLAILDDCADMMTADETRQWEGMITALGEGKNEVRLRPIYATPPNTTPPALCAGELLGDRTSRPHASLACEGPRVFHQGLYIEKVDREARPFAQVEDGRRISFAPQPSSLPEEYAPDMAVVTAPGRHQLWVAIRSGVEEGGVYVRDLDSTATAHIALRDAGQVEVSDDGARAVIASKSALHLVDPATKMITRSATLAGDVNGMALSKDAERVYVSWQEGGIVGRSAIEVRSARTLEAIGQPLRLPDVEVTLLLALPTTTTGPELFIAQKGLSRFLGRTFTRDLTPVMEAGVPFMPYNGVLLPGPTPKIAVVSRFRNAYTEIDVRTVAADPLTAVPFARDLNGIAYDPSTDRIYWSSRDPLVLGWIDRRERRASQDFAPVNRFFGKLAFDSNTRTILALATKEGFVVPVTP